MNYENSSLSLKTKGKINYESTWLDLRPGEVDSQFIVRDI